MPTPFLSAAFPGADGTPLSSVLYDGVHAFVRNAGTTGTEPALLSNAVRGSNASPSSYNFYTAPAATPASADYRVEVDVATVAGTRTDAGVVGRANAATGAFIFFGYIGGNWSIWISGTQTGVQTAVTLADGESHHLLLVMQGRSVRGYVDGALVATATTTLLAAGSAGIYLDGAGFGLDTLTATDGPTWTSVGTDAFTRADGSSVGNGWTPKTAGRWSIVSNQAKAVGGSGYFADNYLSRPDAEACTNARMQVDFAGTVSGGSFPYRSIVLRQTAGIAGGALIGVLNDALEVFTLDANAGADITKRKTVAFAGFNTAHTYRLRATVTTDVGAIAYFVVELWDLTTDPTAASAPMATLTTDVALSAITFPTSGTFALSNNESDVLFDNAAWWSGDTTPAVPPTTNVGPSAVLLSPYTWVQTTETGAAVAITPHPGAYFRTVVSGTASLVLLFNTALVGSPLPDILVTVDGGAAQRYTIADTVDVSAQLSGTGAQVVEVEVAGISIATANRWSDDSARVRFVGLRIAAAGSATPATARGTYLLALTDSVGEGFYAVSATANAAGFDARSWVWTAARLLSAEVGVVGFAGQGLSTTGIGSVPIVPTAYTSIYSGAARDFATRAPDAILVMHGTNDGSTDITAAATALVSALLARTAGPVVWVRPLNGTAQAAHIHAALAGSTTPARTRYIDTGAGGPNTGTAPGAWVNDPGTQMTDTLHPTAAWHQGTGGTLLAAALTAALAPPAPTQTPLQKRRRDMVITLAVRGR